METIKRITDLDPRDLPLVERVFGPGIQTTPNAVLILRVPDAPSTAAAEERFANLVREWKRTRGHSSKIKDLVMNNAYQQIIGMGEPAIPLILEEFERQPGHWSWALTAITGEDPVPQAARGRLKETAEVWLQWGREKGYRR